MLEELRVENLLLIESLDVHFHRGLNVISGETGVGKSLFLSAIGALFGERFNTSSADDRDVKVEGRLTLDQTTRNQLHEALRSDADSGEVVVRVHRRAHGSVRCYVNGSMASRSELQEIGGIVIDVHGQRDMQRLLKEKEQVAALDRFAGTTAQREGYAAALSELERLIDRSQERERRDAEIRERLDFVRFQSDELETAGLRIGEHEELTRRFRMMSRSKDLAEGLAGARVRLEGEDESAYESIVRASRQLERFADDDTDVRALVERLDQAAEVVRDVASDIEALAEERSQIEDDRQDLGERLDLLNHLERKHRTDEAGLISKLVALREEVRVLQEEAESLESLDADIARCEKRVDELGRVLATARQKAGQELSRRLEIELADLKLPAARFAVVSGIEDGKLSPHRSASGPGRPRFLFQANPGGPLVDLAEAASGGEMARVMLALKSILAASFGVPILVFDEIETGVGPRLGLLLGRRLKALSKHHQVICITHLPQIAVFADRHWRIEKSIAGAAARTRIEEIKGEARLEELAAMLGGGDEKLARRQAKALLTEAEETSVVAGEGA